MGRVFRKNEKHGMTKTKIYRVWKDMRDRCDCSSLKYYNRYGGRGISVCKEWNESFIEFYNDMYSTYQEGLQLDRVDNNGNYCKENCKWVSAAINGANKEYKGFGLKGVQLDRNKKKFIARMSADGKSYNIGSFETELEAHNAYMEMRCEWYGLR